MSERCKSCGSSDLVEGALYSTAFMPAVASSWKKASGGAEVTCIACLACGAIDRLRADTARLRKMLPEP